VSKSFSLTLDVKSALPIAEMKSPSHPRDAHMARYSPTYCQAILGANSAALDRDVVLAYRLDKPPTGAKLLASTPVDGDGYFCLMMTAGEELKPASVGMDYVFLLDVSGSMRDDDKLGQSRGALGAFIDMLSPDDQFNCVAFNNAPAAAFRELVPADDGHKKSAQDFLLSRRARGGTDMNAALAAAYRYAQPGRTLNVVVISDGLTEQSQMPALARLVSRRPENSRILCVGVGNDVDRSLLQRMADSSGGLAAFVSTSDDFQRQAASLRRKLQRPALTDVTVDVAGVKTHDLEPPGGRNMFNGVPLRVYGRYAAGGPGNVTLHAMLDGKPYSRTFAVDFPDQADANPEIERMWAWRRIDRLLNQPGGTSMSAIDQIVQLGEKYSIATEYTSFIVLENDGEYARWKIAQRNAMRITQDRDAQKQLETELRTLRQKTPGGLGDPAASPVSDATPASATPAVVSRATPSQFLGSPSALNSVHSGGAFDATYALLVVVMAVLAWMSYARPKTE
jgi:Ca-activated chloride channel family protein